MTISKYLARRSFLFNTVPFMVVAFVWMPITHSVHHLSPLMWLAFVVAVIGSLLACSVYGRVMILRSVCPKCGGLLFYSRPLETRIRNACPHCLTGYKESIPEKGK